jgi:hypothetical protein
VVLPPPPQPPEIAAQSDKHIQSACSARIATYSTTKSGPVTNLP